MIEMKKIIIKEGPLVLIKNIIISEIISSIILYFASFAENYEILYRSMSASLLPRYDIFIMIAFSLFQILLILFVFMRWYFSYFVFEGESCLKITGVFMRRKRYFLLKSVASIESSEHIAERFIRHGSITIAFNQGNPIKIRNVEHYEERISELKSFINLHSAKEKLSLVHLLSLSESEHLEFKETLRFDTKQNIVSRDIERASLKTIAGFLNSGGGVLLLGVGDDKKIFGLARDYETLKRKDADGFESFLMALVKNSLGVEFCQSLDIIFENIEGKEISLVRIGSGFKPAYLTHEGKEEFFIRTGNSTHSLSIREAEEYVRKRWG